MAGVRHQPAEAGRARRRVGHQRVVQQARKAHAFELASIAFQSVEIERRELRRRGGRKRKLRGHVLEHSSLHSGEGEEHMEPAGEAPDDQRQQNEQPRELHRGLLATPAAKLLLQAQVVGF